MLPAGADAVVMVEYTAEHPDQTLEVRRAVAPGENVLLPGEDVAAGDLIVPGGHAAAPPGDRTARGPGNWPSGAIPQTTGSHPFIRR